jgi:hypothetical protein
MLATTNCKAHEMDTLEPPRKFHAIFTYFDVCHAVQFLRDSGHDQAPLCVALDEQH